MGGQPPSRPGMGDLATPCVSVHCGQMLSTSGNDPEGSSKPAQSVLQTIMGQFATDLDEVMDGNGPSGADAATLFTRTKAPNEVEIRAWLGGSPS